MDTGGCVGESWRRTVAKKATDVSHFETAYLGPKRLLILDPVATDTIWLSGGKKSLSACSAIENPSGSCSASSASGPCFRTPGGGGGLRCTAKRTPRKRSAFELVGR